jgi:hypothetical protein
MKNPIREVGMFATPDSMKSWEDWMVGASKGTDAGPFIVTAGMMGWNLASKIIEERIAAERAAKKELEYHGARAYRDRRNAA